MVFSIRKPSNLFALALLLFVLVTIYVSPFLSVYSKGIEHKLTESSLLLNSLLLTLFLVGAPIVWLMVVDRMKLKETLHFMRLKGKEIKTALAFGLIAFLIIFLSHLFMAVAIYANGIHLENPLAKSIVSTISIPAMLTMFVSQSTAEEIFFRGFIMKKLEQRMEIWAAVAASAILFGIAHLGYGEAYQIFMPVIMGLILGYFVIKTDHLLTSIVAHVSFNVFIYSIAVAVRTTLTL